MTEKNIDGIKKLNEEEIKKSRKILLDYIGEEDRKKARQKIKKSEKIFSATKRKEMAVDGISVKKEKNQVPNIPSETMPMEIPAVQEEKKVKSIPSEEEKENLKKEIEKNEQEQEQEVELKKEAEKKAKIKKKNLVVLKKKEILQKSRQEIKEAKARVEKKKKKIKAKRRKIKTTSNSLLPKLRQTRKKKAKQLSFNFKFLDKLIPFFKAISKNFYIIIFSFIIFIIVFYIIHALFLLKFGIDSSFSRKISNIVPVPAVITGNGYLEYFDYKDLTRNISENKKLEVSKKIILLDLIEKYNISENTGAENIVKEINNNFKNDTEINSVNISLEEYLINEVNNKKIWFLTN